MLEAIAASHLGKAYRIYEQPSERIWEIITRKPRHQLFTALDDVSFSLPHGATCGIIGDNGAGKSTLLKILAGTLTPSVGTLQTDGRIAALLELGAGFNADFTGRQNIHLNAALLGLSEREIKAKEEEIIDFSELEEFIDRPVRTYSSGMYVRLAFSIATSVNPDILIIDEALSVGDQHFQKKSVERILSFKEAGKTILFCTHSLYQVQEMCELAIWMHHGRVQAFGNSGEVVQRYIEFQRKREAEIEKNKEQSEAKAQSAMTIPLVSIESIEVLDPEKQLCDSFSSGDTLVARVHLRNNGASPVTTHLAIGLIEMDDTIVFGTTTKLEQMDGFTLVQNKTIEVAFRNLPINAGTFKVKAITADDSGLVGYEEKHSDPFWVKSDRPEMGILDIDLDWAVL